MRQIAARNSEPVGSLAQRWEELHSTAAQLAKVADLAPEAFGEELSAFPKQIGNAAEWQRTMALQGIEDIGEMMSPGLTALSTITARGQDASVPALALWREFHHARESVLALVQPAAD